MNLESFAVHVTKKQNVYDFVVNMYWTLETQFGLVDVLGQQ